MVQKVSKLKLDMAYKKAKGDGKVETVSETSQTKELNLGKKVLNLTT